MTIPARHDGTAAQSTVKAKSTVRSTPRPRDRKAQILTVARGQFARRGYHGVSMEDIASEVGITAAALYRHFPNKQELLAQAMLTYMAQVVESVEEVDPHDSAAIFLHLARRGFDQNVRAVLFDQEARNLTPERRAEARAGIQSIVGRLTGALRVERPDLPDADIDLLAWALTSVATNVARTQSKLSRKRAELLFTQVADAIRTTTALPPEAPDSPKPRGTGLSHISKREALLSAAIAQLRQRGYQSITMEDIGAAAGMSRSGIYTYFTSKADVLLAILSRRTETLRLGLAQALAEADSREDALSRIVHSYTSTVAAPDSAIGVLIEESAHLPEDTRNQARALQREYIEEWMNLLGSDSPETRATVVATLRLINDLTRGPRRARPRAIESLAHRILTSAGTDLPEAGSS